MHKLELEINDRVYEKILFFLESFAKKDLKIKKKVQDEARQDLSLVDFFRTSPLVGELDLERSQELYQERFIV